MKGISAIIATILLLLITISLAGTAYLFVSGTLSGRTSKNIGLVSVDENAFVISNDGTETIMADEIQAIVNGKIVEVTGLANIEPKKTLVIFLETREVGQADVIIKGPSNSVNGKIESRGWVYRDGDYNTFDGRTGSATYTRDSTEKYEGSYSFKIEGTSSSRVRRWSSPLPDSTNADTLTFAYKKGTAGQNARFYFAIDGPNSWIYVTESTGSGCISSHPIIRIPKHTDTEWHLVKVNLDDVIPTCGGVSRSTRGQLVNFQFVSSDSVVTWYDNTYFS